MKPSEAKRVFSCFVMILIAMFFLCGCSTVKWEWMPEKDEKNQKGYKEGVVVDVVKVSF